MKEHIVSKLADAVYRLQIAGSLPAEGLPEIMVERTRERAHGDFATNFAMLLAKPARRKPRELAELLVTLNVMDTQRATTRSPMIACP